MSFTNLNMTILSNGGGSDNGILKREDSYRGAVGEENKTLLSGTTKTKKPKSVILIPDVKHEKLDMKQELALDEHRIPIQELYDRLGTDPITGLTTKEADLRLYHDGPNKLKPPRATPEWVKFFTSLFGGFSLLIWIAAMLCFIAYGIHSYAYELPNNEDLYLGIVLTIVVIASGLFTFYQEYRSYKVMKSFKHMQPDSCLVIRDGLKEQLLSEKIVVGDILEFKFGDRLPADVRIIEAQLLKIDMSTLTGEPHPVVKTIEYTNENPLETKNLAFYSCNVMEGLGKGVVINTGDRTVVGRIANLAADLDIRETPLSKELRRFIDILTIIAIILGVGLFIATMLVGYQWLECIIFLIGIIVAFVPEGLHVTVTVCLTLAAQIMAKKNCLVRHLDAVEILGSTSVICSDKTGTLTRNELTVTHVWFDNRIMEVDASEDQSSSMFDRNSAGWQALSRVAVLCNRAEFWEHANNSDGGSTLKRPCIGDPNDAALLKCVELSLGNTTEFRKQYPKVAELPFNSVNKYHLSVHIMPDDKRYLVLMKGAPELIVDRCNSILINGQQVPLTPAYTEAFTEACNSLASNGLKVLACCDSFLPEDRFPRGFQFDLDIPNIPVREMRLLGIMAMVDPPRASVTDAITKCRGAGIKVIMISGDHPMTAKAIARQVGIISDYNRTVDDIAGERGVSIGEVDPRDANAIVIHGSEVRHMTMTQLTDIIRHYKEIVFARSTWQQKMQVVEACQKLGHVVAVTGEGVSDAAALLKADVGIAMGLSGTDVACQASDIVLLDDNFSTIVTGIEEGRKIYDNIKKSIVYTLTSNIPEVIPFLFFIITSVPLPLGVITVLCIDLGTDLFPAISLAYEKAETDLMLRRPRDYRNEKLITDRVVSRSYGQIGMVEVFGGFFSYFVVMAEHGFWPATLFGIRRKWDSESIQDVEDSYGQEWSYMQRKSLERTCQTAFFVAIVVVQWANLLVCKTRRLSLFQQGMSNHPLTFALFFETGLAIFMVYCPGVNTGLRMMPLRCTYWLPAMLFGLVIIIFDEVRKMILRRSKDQNNFVYRETYY